MSRQPILREKLEALQEENKFLRERLGLGKQAWETSWEIVASVEQRDKMAVRALLAEWGAPNRAIIRLGYEYEDFHALTPEARRELLARVFETPGVKALLAENLADIEAQRAQILARQAQIALYGNDDASARSAVLLAKIAGWSPEDKPAAPVSVNLYTLVGAGVGGAAGIASAAQAKAVETATLSSDPLALLAHDPGAPVRIDSGDEAIKAALECDE